MVVVLSCLKGIFQPGPYFPFVFVSKRLMGTKIFDVGPVLSKIAAVGSGETSYNASYGAIVQILLTFTKVLVLLPTVTD